MHSTVKAFNSQRVAALGTVAMDDVDLPHCWTSPRINTDRKICDLTAAVSDALPGRISSEEKQRKLGKKLSEIIEKASALEERLTVAEESQAALTAITTSRSWRLVLRLRGMRARLMPVGSRREHIAKLSYRAMRKVVRTLRNRPLRRLASRSVKWAIAHSPRRVIDHFDLHQSLYVGLLPHVVKESLKKMSRGEGPNVSLRQELDQFLSREMANNPINKVFLIFSSVTFTESEGQRSTRFARELARRGIPVIFAYWRWDTTTPPDVSTFPGVFCLPIDDFLKDHESILSDARLGSLERVFLMEFPHPSLMEIVNYANAYGWRTVYDVIDDWEEFHKQGQACWYDRDLETYLLQNADIATITCENLLEKMTAMGADRTHLLPNAFEDWTAPNRHMAPPVRKGRITIGYFGHLTCSWFDWPLIVTVAKRRPDWTFHIIGYGLDKRIAPCDNLIFLGKVQHCDLPAFAKNWDVAMIPFQESKLCSAVDPVKIYEYISLGLPTVVTGLPHLASYPGVLTANGELEFEAAVEMAAKMDIDETTVKTFLSSNRWANRIDTLHSILHESEQRCATSMALEDDISPANLTAA